MNEEIIILNNEDAKIIKYIKDDVRYVDITIREMCKSVKSWIDDDAKELQEAINLVKQAEMDANKIKNKVMARVSENTASLHRTDFLRLILRLDSIADYAEGVAYRMQKINFKCDKKLGDFIIPLCDAILKMGPAFKKAIVSLLENTTKTTGYCDEIDKIEEETDVAYRNLESYLFQSEMEFKKVYWLKTIMKQIEQAGDLCQDAAEAIRILIATL